MIVGNGYTLKRKDFADSDDHCLKEHPLRHALPAFKNKE